MTKDLQENDIKTLIKEDQDILRMARDEQDLEDTHKAQSIVDYFAMVSRAKKELKKTHPEIPESDLDLYL